MDRQGLRVFALVPAHVVAADLTTGRRRPERQCSEPDDRLTGRERVEQLAGEHVLRSDVLRVDDGARAGYGDRLLQRSDLHVSIHVRCKPRRELDPFASARGESLQGKRDGVGARPQFGDLVPALCVGDGHAHFLNQRGTGGLHGHARQLRACRVLDFTGNGTAESGLSQSGVRMEQEPDCGKETREHPEIPDFPSCH